MIITTIEATTIPDSWFQCVSKVQEVGFRYVIQQGSFVGQTRLEFDWITICISHPYSEPYDTMLPEIPQHLGIPNPVAKGYIEQYLPYIMTDLKKKSEDYTYGERLTRAPMSTKIIAGSSITKISSHEELWRLTRVDQIEHFIEVLKNTPNTNQAILQIGQPSDCGLDDPPCLRHIDMRVKDKMLIFYPYFRSWDLWSGMAPNLAAIAILQKYMADEIGVASGEIIASSKGLHLYGYVEQLAKLRCGK